MAVMNIDSLPYMDQAIGNGNGQNLILMHMCIRVKPLINDHLSTKTKYVKDHIQFRFQRCLNYFLSRPLLYKDHYLIHLL